MVRAYTLLLLLSSTSIAVEPLQVITWNVESGGSSPSVISTQLAELPKSDIFALQEVAASDIGRYGDAIRRSHGKSFRYFATWTGGNDRLFVAFDEQELTLLEWRELFQYGGHEMNDWRHRSPLVCLFKHNDTGQNLYFVTVHLARRNEKLRKSQATGLRLWASRVGQPIIAIGDFNFDYDFKAKRGNASYNALITGNTWQWAKPKKLVDTNWADNDGDGRDNYPDSCLDFAFYAGLKDGWSMTSEVVVGPGDFPDDNTTSDHRPVFATVSFDGSSFAASPSVSLEPSSLADSEPETPVMSYWLNSKTGVRHNKSCRNFGKTKRGRPCSADEGRPCGICGG